MAISDRIAVMRDGVIHHCGEPKNIYQRPADLFVATFIGKSNLVDARMKAAGGKAYLVFRNGYEVEVSTVREGEIRDRNVTVSIRPEELLVARYDPAVHTAGLKAVINDSVFLGSNTHYFVTLETGEKVEIIQESEIDSIIPPGSEVMLTLKAKKVNLFDPESTLSLMKGVSNSAEQAAGKEEAK